MSNKILVIGATGNVGHSLVQLLAVKGQTVKAASRHPAKSPQGPNIEAIAFDYDQPASYGPALAGVDRLFAISKTADASPQTTLIPLLDQAKAAGVKHVVLMTAAGVEQAEEAGLRKVEKHLIASGSAYTILRPTWFMQNFAPGFILPTIQQSGAIYLPAGEGKTSFIDTRDIAAVAAAVLTEPGHAGQEYTLTGDQALTYGEAAAIISQVSGRTVQYVAISEEQMREALLGAGWAPEQAAFMNVLFGAVRAGWAAGISPAVKQILGRDPIKFAQFAAENAAAWR
jgi:uncharacterized protein YbjT (DUF2867 family)